MKGQVNHLNSGLIISKYEKLSKNYLETGYICDDISCVNLINGCITSSMKKKTRKLSILESNSKHI